MPGGDALTAGLLAKAAKSGKMRTRRPFGASFLVSDPPRSAGIDHYFESLVSEMAVARQREKAPESLIRRAKRGWAKTRTRLT